MSTLKCSLNCSKCLQAKHQPVIEWKSLRCLLTRSPFTLRLLLIDILMKKISECVAAII